MSNPRNNDDSEQITLILKELGRAEIYRPPQVTPLQQFPNDLQPKNGFKPR